MKSKERPEPGGMRADTVATRARIVAAAEKLFASRGIDGTSLVEVGRAAGQRNRSAVQYHFGDKRGLIHAILDKHTPGIERRRHERLDEIEAAGDFGLRQLAEVLVLPAAEKLIDPDGGVAFVRINAELIGHPSFPLLALDGQRVNRAGDRLRRLTVHASPRLPQPLWLPRWLLVTGLLFHGMADWSRLPVGAQPSCDVFVAHLVDSIVALLDAPASPATEALLEEEKSA